MKELLYYSRRSTIFFMALTLACRFKKGNTEILSAERLWKFIVHGVVHELNFANEGSTDIVSPVCDTHQIHGVKRRTSLGLFLWWCGSDSETM